MRHRNSSNRRFYSNIRTGQSTDAVRPLSRSIFSTDAVAVARVLHTELGQSLLQLLKLFVARVRGVVLPNGHGLRNAGSKKPTWQLRQFKRNVSLESSAMCE